jgi:endonuclease/exonuclease/phosphatase family metal-dependent hydrolase
MSLIARSACLLIVTSLSLAPAGAQWDPDNGAWGKQRTRDVRLMTWNILDGICSTNNKTEGFNNWSALVRIVSAMRPDVLVMQEVGDNDGNGTGSGVDSVSTLTTVLDLFLHGGDDPYRGGTPVTAYVQKYAPGYDLPYVYVSAKTDNYNRNVLLSRMPFSDLNGDTKSTYSDIPLLLGHLYATAGNGGIRGFLMAELELSDDPYLGDLVVGTAHLKAGGSSQDRQDRLNASQRIAYVLDYWYNGGGLGVPDPHAKIVDSPPATDILDDWTPILVGGDWNEDELNNGRRGPVDWITRAEVNGGDDGTDRDRSDMQYDSAVHQFDGRRNTQSGSKLDYIGWQDSITLVGNQFLFHTSGTPSGALPAEVRGFPVPGVTSGTASDHTPVIVDFILPLIGDGNRDGRVDVGDLRSWVACSTGPGGGPVGPDCAFADADRDRDVDLADFRDMQSRMVRD